MSDPQQSSAQLKYRIYYNFGRSAEMMPWMYEEAQRAQLKTLASGSVELQLKDEVLNDGSSFFLTNGFFCKDRRFAGWRVRFRTDDHWFWILEDGSYALKSTYDAASMAPIRLFGDGEHIPYLPLSNIDLMVAEAVWEEGPADSYNLLCNSGTKTPDLTWDYEESYGHTERLQTGSAEYRLREQMNNVGNFRQADDDGNSRPLNMSSSSAENRPDAPAVNKETPRLMKNGFCYPGYVFIGWHLRLKCRGKWYWLLDDLSVKLKASYDKRADRPLRLLEDGAVLPFFAESGLTMVVAEAVWKKEEDRSADIIRDKA